MNILFLIIIIKSEVWTITHCLGLGHETMVCAVCLPVFLWKRFLHYWPFWASYAELWCFLCCQFLKHVEQSVKLPVICGAQLWTPVIPEAMNLALQRMNSKFYAKYVTHILRHIFLYTIEIVRARRFKSLYTFFKWSQVQYKPIAKTLKHSHGLCCSCVMNNK